MSVMYPNPRFPHTCTVYRDGEGGDAFSDGEEAKILYEGECRNYNTTRNIGDAKVQSSQYTLAIPAYKEITGDTEVSEEDEIVTIEGKQYKRIIVKAFAGDKVKCTDARGMEQFGIVVDCYAGTMGNNVYWNYDAN